jgi:hypothetical protein
VCAFITANAKHLFIAGPDLGTHGADTGIAFTEWPILAGY